MCLFVICLHSQAMKQSLEEYRCLTNNCGWVGEGVRVSEMCCDKGVIGRLLCTRHFDIDVDKYRVFTFYKQNYVHVP